MNTYYKPGSWNVACMVCGVYFKSDKIKKRWDGLLVCERDYETRNSLDFIRGRSEDPTAPFQAPPPADVFIEHTCLVPGLSGIAGYAQAACAKPSSKLLE